MPLISVLPETQLLQDYKPQAKHLLDSLAEMLGALEAAADVAKPFLHVDLEIASFQHHSAN